GSNLRWHPGAVEIGPEADAIIANMREHVFDMVNDQINWSVAVPCSVRPQKSRGKVDAHQAASITDCRQLLVRQISRLRAQGVGIRVRCNERRVADRRYIPEASFIDVGEVEEDMELVASPH